MADDKDKTVAKDKTVTPTAAPSGAQVPRRGAISDRQQADANKGIEHIRDILVGDIVVEIERRLARLDHLITHRNSEIQHDVKNRTDVLEAHVRKEIETLGTRTVHDNSELSATIRAIRSEHRNEMSQFEQRLARIEDRIETSIARVEREARDQLLAQAKTFIEELERVRSQLRAALASELGLAAEPLEQEGEHAEPFTAPH